MWGAGFVLFVLLVLALLILTATPVRDAAHGLSAALAAAARAGGRDRPVGGGDLRSGAERRAALGPPSVRRSIQPSPAAAVRPGGGSRGGRPRGRRAAGGAQPRPRPPDPADARNRPHRGPAARTRPPAGPAARPADPEQLTIGLGPAAEPGTWRLPPLALLKRSKATEIDRRQVESLGHTLEDALAAHGVETRLVGMTVGPTVTRYELELGPGVKVAKVTNLQRDIAYAMAAADVRILAPIPGRSAIGVEVPNQQRQLVAVGDILTSAEAHAATHPLEVALGRDIAGRPILENLATMPHILIAGATGAGKSSCINTPGHVGPAARHAGPGAPDPGRPQAGRARPVQRPAAPADRRRHQPEEGGQRPVVGRARDGAPLRPARRGRRAGHHRLQRGLRPGRPRPSRRRWARSPASTNGCPSSSSSSTSSTTS